MQREMQPVRDVLGRLDLGQGDRRGGTKTSVVRRFCSDLDALLLDLSQTYSRFIRCIKPNGLAAPKVFERPSVLALAVSTSSWCHASSSGSSGSSVTRTFESHRPPAASAASATPTTRCVEQLSSRCFERLASTASAAWAASFSLAISASRLAGPACSRRLHDSMRARVTCTS